MNIFKGETGGDTRERELIRKIKRFLRRENSIGTVIEKNVFKVEDSFIGMYIELE